MTTRYTAVPQTRFNVPGLPTGYQTKSTPSDVAIPAVGIEDAEKALFNLFNAEIPFIIDQGENGMKRVPVIFAAGEKWALQKNKRGVKDRNGSLILPLITIVRNTIAQASDEDIAGRGINQQTGEIVIHRRLDRSDRGYQALINRLLLQHQPNLAVNPANADAGQLTTLRTIGDLAGDPQVQQGALLLPDRKNNIYETIVVPAPQFYTAQYDVTFWTQYTTHMNQMIEQLMSSFLQQGNQWRLDTPKGYWFLASVVENSYSSDSNTDDYSQSERLVRYKFVVKVPGYILASKTPGTPVAIKRYVSSPVISFGVGAAEVDEPSGVDNPFLGADDPTLPLDAGDDATPTRRDQRRRTDTRLLPHQDDTNPNDPALGQLARGTNPAQFQKVTGIDQNGNKVTKLFRVRSKNKFTGETVLAPDASLGGLTFVITED